MIHAFLRAIGFRSITRSKDIYGILEDVVKHPDEQTRTQDANGNTIGCFLKYFGKGFGIKVCGDFLNDTEFHICWYFPVFNGSYVSTYEQIEVERFAEKEAFAGICDDVRMGVTLIFSVSNMEEILEKRQQYGNSLLASNAVLSGLASSGKILLPVSKTAAQQQEMAERMGTQKSNISRLESGRYNPSLDFLIRSFECLGKRISLHIN